jgi:signal transduction histidine kinase
MRSAPPRSSVHVVTGFSRLRIPVPDAVLSLCVLALAESEVWLRWRDGGDGVPSAARPAEAVVLAVPAVALAWRRRSPTAAAVVVGGAAVLQVAAVARYAPFLPLLLPLLLVNYANAAYGRSRLRIAGLAAVTGGVATVVALIPEARTSSEALFSAVVVAGSWLVGDVVRQRQRRLEIVEASREEWARAAVAGERVRIARELHDVVAHSVSLMGVQAGAARLLLDEDVVKARRALASIEATARDSVAELQRLLAILRTADAEELEPQPTLSDLPALAAATRASGLAVNLETDAHAAHLAPGPSLAAYRIVQEALTNVLKHAQATRADVRVAVEGDALEVEVVDDGRGLRLRRRRGHGLIGMHERAMLYGGTLEAGRRADGGFTVRARFPLGGRST